MNNAHHMQDIKDHWERDGLSQAIHDALIASGKSLDTLSIDDLAPFDQFHGGGKSFTSRLALLADLKPGMNILDVGGGLGGPARTLAVGFGCQVTVIDLADSYVLAGRMLTDLMRLNDSVTHQVGNALELPFDDHSFDAVWTQNSGMNIMDKETLYKEIHRVIRPKGLFATQEPMSGPNQPPIFPIMWSRDGKGHFLRTQQEMRALIESIGFQTRKWEDVTHEKSAPSPASAHTIQNLVMGETLLAKIRDSDKRNVEEERIVTIHAVFDRL